MNDLHLHHLLVFFYRETKKTVSHHCRCWGNLYDEWRRSYSG